MRRLPNVVMPFPGGVVRSGSKVGSKYRGASASTNDAFCPTLTGLSARSELSAEVGCVLEIVIDGLTDADVGAAMSAGIGAAVGLVAVTLVLIFDQLIPVDRQPAFLTGSQLRPLFSAAGQKGFKSLPPEIAATIDRLKQQQQI